MKAHGIMFHHFHDERSHIVSQGSITAEQLDDLLCFYSKTHNIINADEFVYKSEHNLLESKDVCLTFDDGLLCQFDIAYPVLKAKNITAFWFVYTSPLDGVIEKLEIYRHFRFSMFSDIENFYEAFFNIVHEESPETIEALKSYNPDKNMIYCPFYTPNDKRFRYLRDDLLDERQYFLLMDKMIEKYNYDVVENAKGLWIKEEEIRVLHNSGNLIGLHSYSHPTVMKKRNYEEQYSEYVRNKNQLESIIEENVISASYPCNSYNMDSLRCMNELGIKIGFRDNMLRVRCINNRLEYPREDHSNIIRSILHSRDSTLDNM